MAAPPKPRARRVTPPVEALPWYPPPYELADIHALKAFAEGRADADQQKRAMHWIIFSGAATYDAEFRPGGEDGRRASDFAAGRRFVGLQLVKLINLTPQALEAMRKVKDARDHGN